jgi:3-hexulose-6-phosphate synthase
MIRNSLLNKLREKKNLQVALDFIDINDAIRVARESIEAGAEIIEDGTPLVKSAGIQGLLKLSEISDGKILLADTKTADAGDVEVEIAKKGNAKIMTVLGIMDDSTIESAVKKAKELDILVQADLINVKDVIQRAKELHEIGVDIIGLHVGLDVQKKRNITVASLKEEIKEISKFTIVSVAGGLNANNIKDLIDIPINIYVVGGAITRSNNPYEATKEIVNVINTSYK